MKKINIAFLFPFMALMLLLYALSNQLFNVPPLGKLLDPFQGAVQNDAANALETPELNLSSLPVKAPVKVLFDKRKVPHIFAQNNQDLYFAQGYVCASLRLWQMDFSSYAAAGRLSEIFGWDETLNYDREQRRIGMLDAAKASLALMEDNEETRLALNNYTNGVNAFIQQLTYKNMPFEYKLLDYKPEPWTNLKSVLILKQMANTLSGYEEDVFMSKMMLTLNDELFNKYYPDFHSHISPIVNSTTFTTNAALTHVEKPTYLEKTFISSLKKTSINSYNPKLGTNCWAVSGKKTKSGKPILCCDPHLNLSLPSVWIEMQLNSPDMNVYGVSIPGTPAVIIGFNNNIAWGVSNGADDVKDWYKLTFSPDHKKYEFNGNWLDLKREVFEIRQKGKAPFFDTVFSTIQGPIVSDNNFIGSKPELKDYALKWELHNPSNEFLTFIHLNKAANYQDFKEAIHHYKCPTQNFTFAGKDNTIALHHQGNMAIKWPGQGKFVLDGSKKNHLPLQYIPADSLPQTLNPDCNYVFSANQHPTFADYTYYYNGYYSETRANRIKQLLENENKFDAGKMKEMQLDNTNLLAVNAMPVLLNKLDKKLRNPEEQNFINQLGKWKGTYNINDEYAMFFEIWWGTIKAYTWDEWEKLSFYYRHPEDYILIDLLANEPENDYFDKQGTALKENAKIIIDEAFNHAIDKYTRLKKENGIKWGNNNKVNIIHLSNLEAFSNMNIASAGNPETINAMSRNWGPSWRMIVELGERPTAYGIYAGGQSGAIGSPYYNNFVDDWNKGKYYPLQYFLNEEEAKKNAENTWLLNL